MKRVPSPLPHPTVAEARHCPSCGIPSQVEPVPPHGSKGRQMLSCDEAGRPLCFWKAPGLIMWTNNIDSSKITSGWGASVREDKRIGETAEEEDRVEEEDPAEEEDSFCSRAKNCCQELVHWGPLQTTMTKDYQDIKALDVEGEGGMHSGRAPAGFTPHQSWVERVRHRLGLILLGLICVAAIATVAFGISGRRFDSDLLRLEESFRGVNRTVSAAFAALKQKQAENTKTLLKMDTMMKNLMETWKDTKTQLQDQISKLRVTFRTLNCDLQKIKRNQTGGQVTCCLPGWVPHRQSCYWFSKAQKTWDEAKVDCEDKDAHLVIITGYIEQQFVSQQTKPRYTWIGLTLTGRNWEWVGGIEYTPRLIDWKPVQTPSLQYHVSGETRFCAHLHHDGLWNAEHCARRYNWVCEMEVRS